MRRVMTQSCFVLVVLSVVGWLVSIILWAIVSVFEINWSEPTRNALRLVAMGGEVPLLFFGWLYQTLKVKTPPAR